MFYTKKRMHMHAYRTRCMVTQVYAPPLPPPPALTRAWATIQVKHVDMLYLGAYTEGGRYFGRALLQVFMVCTKHDVTEFSITWAQTKHTYSNFHFLFFIRQFCIRISRWSATIYSHMIKKSFFCMGFLPPDNYNSYFTLGKLTA